jgi:hypothetical protein
MSEKKIELRNKFILKINRNIDKLTNDINLLTEVDKSLYNLSGGTGKIAAALRNFPVNSKLTQEATRLSDQLTTKIQILESSIDMLLNFITNNTGDISSIKDNINGMEAEYSLDILTKFNDLYTKYVINTDNDTGDYDTDAEYNELDPGIKLLLKNAIDAARAARIAEAEAGTE